MLFFLNETTKIKENNTFNIIKKKNNKCYSNFYEKLKPSEIDKIVGFFINSFNSGFL